MSITIKLHDNKSLDIEKQIKISDSWARVKELVTNDVEKQNKLLFSYEDEENDTVVGSTDMEWSSLTQLAAIKPLLVDIYVNTKCCNDSLSFVKVAPDVLPEAIITSVSPSEAVITSGNKKKLCCSSDNLIENLKLNGSKPEASCCGSSEGCCPPVQSYDVDDGIPLVNIKNPTLEAHQYSGESLRAVTLPLGPIGGGNISIAGDGGLRQWQISNKVNHVAAVPDSFFAVKVGNKSFVLQSDKLYDASGFKPAPIISDHIVPQCSIDLLKVIPGVSDVEITAKYPVVEVDYKDSSLPVEVHLESWSPKIPSNSKDSAIPAIIFDFHVKNTSTNVVDISLLSSLQNIAGWNGHDVINNEVDCHGYGGNANSLLTSGSLYGIDMNNLSLASDHPFNGHVAIAGVSMDGDKLSSMLQYTTVKSLWSYFNSTGLPGQGLLGPSQAGTTYNGAVNIARTLKPGESSVFTYILGWHFPNRYRDWNLGVTVPNTNVFVGNYYATQWKTMQQVLEYTRDSLDRLRKATYAFRDAMFNSTLPWQLIDSAAGRVSVLNSPSCMWQADGNFYAFEGCSTTSGCCPLNCTHVWNYEMALAILYPDVERTMREIDLVHMITPHGVIPSRTTCPLELRRQWQLWENYATDPASCTICVDGEIGTVLKTYREVLHGAPKDWLHKLWPAIKLVMNHWLNVLDGDKNGLVYGPQPNTYDVSTYGYMVLIGALYLCGLRAAEEMAILEGDKDFEKICHDRFLLGTVNLDAKCFTNGKWYTHVVDPNHATNVLTDATVIGVMYGQWWAHILNLGYLLPKEHVQSHLIYTFERNFVTSFDFKQSPRTFCDARDNGWITGKWDDGKRPQNPLRYTGEAAWSGVLYPFAGLLLVEGLQHQSLQVLEVIRYLYDGTRRSPWNEIECGDHYTRCMSAFALFKLAAGNSWTRNDDDTLSLTFNPIMNQSDFKGFFSVGTAWGSYMQCNVHEKRVQLSVSYGMLNMSTLNISMETYNGVMIFKYNANNQKTPVKHSISKKMGSVTSIVFHEPCHLSAEEYLRVDWLD